MRGTQSRTTELHGAVAPADRVVRRVDPGPQPDLLEFGIFAVFEILLAFVYTGVARRALELVVDRATTRRSKKTGRAEEHQFALQSLMRVLYTRLCLEKKNKRITTQ